MADNKQNNLNGAFYGPSIPPPTNTFPTSSGRSCLCTFFCILFKIILALVIIVGLAILILWLIYRPTKLKFHVTDATLTEFDLSNNTLKYNLAVNITAHNPNRRVGVYYEKIDVLAYYGDQRFSSVPLNGFYQGTKNTTVWSPVFQGQNIVVLNWAGLTYFDAQKSNGLFSIALKVNLRWKYEFAGKFKTDTMTPNFECYLKVPLSGNENDNLFSFQTTTCHLDM